MTRKMSGKEGMMNKAEGAEPKSGHRPPAKARDNAGPEKHADVKGAQEGGSFAENSPTGLSGAMHELHSQHPHKHHDHGPHHGTKDHVRHMPLHGLRPHKG